MWKPFSCELWHFVQAQALQWELQSDAIQLLPPCWLAWGLAEPCRTQGEAFVVFEMAPCILSELLSFPQEYT